MLICTPLCIYAYQQILGAMHIYRTPSIFSIFSILAYLTCYAYISNPPYTQHIQNTSISQVLCIYIDPHLYLAYQHISGALHIYRPPLYFAYLAHQHISGAMHIYRPPSIFSIYAYHSLCSHWFECYQFPATKTIHCPPLNFLLSLIYMHIFICIYINSI